MIFGLWRKHYLPAWKENPFLAFLKVWSKFCGISSMYITSIQILQWEREVFSIEQCIQTLMLYNRSKKRTLSSNVSIHIFKYLALKHNEMFLTLFFASGQPWLLGRALVRSHSLQQLNNALGHMVWTAGLSHAGTVAGLNDPSGSLPTLWFYDSVR